MPGFPGPYLPGTYAKPPPVLKKRRALPAVWMRAGTSKGLYLHRRDLPLDQKDWPAVITRVMGSHDGDLRQLNGIGGATSTTSKAAVISTSQRQGVDVDYTFVQVPLGGRTLEMSGNCGNIASGVGPFAVDEGLISVKPGQSEAKVRVFNTNTSSVIEETVQIDNDGHFVEDGDFLLPGLHSIGSRVQMSFVDPAGSMTGKLLPTGNPAEVLLVQMGPTTAPKPVRVSMVDAGNPFAIVDAETLPTFYHDLGPAAVESLAFVEAIRRQAAVAMGLADSVEVAALTRGTPKIAVISEPTFPVLLAAEHQSGSALADVQCVAYSMGKVHGSLQLTGAVCLAAAFCTTGTVAHAVRSRQRRLAGSGGKLPGSKSVLNTQQVRLRHPGGDMDVEVRLGADGIVQDVTVLRTARRLFEGKVFYLQ